MISARTQMSSRRRLHALITLLVGVVTFGAWACSLNPQPIPPGFSDSIGTDAGRSGDASTGPFNGLDGAGGATPDAAVPAPGDASDGGEDASDAASDAPSDADDGGG